MAGFDGLSNGELLALVERRSQKVLQELKNNQRTKPPGPSRIQKIRAAMVSFVEAEEAYASRIEDFDLAQEGKPNAGG